MLDSTRVQRLASLHPRGASAPNRRRFFSLVAALMACAPASGAQKAPAKPPTAPPPFPITAVAPSKAGERLVFIITGEGGKTDFETALARDLSADGAGVLIFDSRAYLASAKTPARTAAEVEESVRRYAKVWNRERLVVVGNSRGADLAPFIVNRLSHDVHDQVDGVVLLGPQGRASFQVTLREVVGAKPRATDLPVMPELERLRGTRIVCAYGRDERGSFCSRVDSTLIRIVARDGAHRLAAADSKVIAKILAEKLGP